MWLFALSASFSLWCCVQHSLPETRTFSSGAKCSCLFAQMLQYVDYGEFVFTNKNLLALVQSTFCPGFISWSTPTLCTSLPSLLFGYSEFMSTEDMKQFTRNWPSPMSSRIVVQWAQVSSDQCAFYKRGGSHMNFKFESSWKYSILFLLVIFIVCLFFT